MAGRRRRETRCDRAVDFVRVIGNVALRSRRSGGAARALAVDSDRALAATANAPSRRLRARAGDREIVSSSRLILVISKRVGDLSADPPDACSRVAGQLTRDARLLQSPRSGTVAGGHTLAAGIAQNGQRGAGCWFCPKAAVRAVPARLLLLCLLFRSSWLTVEGDRHVSAAGVLHRRGGRAAVAVSVGVTGGVP
jgi:hypothetical protein